MKPYLEKLATIAIFAGIFFPARLLFYYFVSDHWIGSFGLMSGILIGILYLSRRGKLGLMGRIMETHIRRVTRGKAGTGFLVMSLFVLYFFGNMIYGIDHVSESRKQAITAELEKQGISTIHDVTYNMPKVRLSTPDIVFGTIILLLPNPVAYATYSIINDMSHGWVQHAAIVFFMEQIEVFCLVVYFRHFGKTLSTTKGNAM